MVSRTKVGSKYFSHFFCVLGQLIWLSIYYEFFAYRLKDAYDEHQKLMKDLHTERKKRSYDAANYTQLVLDYKLILLF